MFDIGNRVVHPAYGSGTIVGITGRQLGAELRTYYVIELPKHSGRLMVPITRAVELGLRLLTITPTQVLQVLGSKPASLPDDHRERQESISAEISSNNVLSVSKVIRDLAYRDKAGSLTKTDRRLYLQAEDFLAEELAFIQDVDLEAARGQIRSALESVQAE